jgi:hypothetical protein
MMLSLQSSISVIALTKDGCTKIIAEIDRTNAITLFIAIYLLL